MIATRTSNRQQLANAESERQRRVKQYQHYWIAQLVKADIIDVPVDENGEQVNNDTNET